MLLGTESIRQALADGAVVCDPAPVRIEGAHIDVTLGPHYWRFRLDGGQDWMGLEFTDPRDYFRQCLGGGAIEVPAHGFILAHTAEYIGTAPGSGLVPMLHTRSTLARWGLSVCTANAGQGDEGYVSRWTLEIVNPHSVAIALPVGARVGSINFHRIEGAAAPYALGTRYNTAPTEWTPLEMLPRKGNW